MSEEKKTSYLFKFEEMIESRNDTISNCEKVLSEQEYLVNVLESHDSSKGEKHFEKLLEEINAQILNLHKYILNLKHKNAKTENLLSLLKSNKNYDEICTLICEELEVFQQNNLDDTEAN